MIVFLGFGVSFWLFFFFVSKELILEMSDLFVNRVFVSMGKDIGGMELNVLIYL